MPLRHPFFIGKNQVTFQNTIFLLLHALCVFLGASVCLVFFISLVLFAAINGWTPTNFRSDTQEIISLVLFAAINGWTPTNFRSDTQEIFVFQK
jgi:hypothetical protein